MFEVLIDILHVHAHVLRHVLSVRSAKRAALATQHKSALRHLELRVADDAVAHVAETLRKAERAAEPFDGTPDILVDQHRHNGGARR
jgi:hypothetical protein